VRALVVWLVALATLVPLGATVLPTAPASAADRLVVASLPGESLSSGGQHACAIATDGRLSCWGATDLGQLGDGGVRGDRPSPVYVRPAAGWTSVSAGGGTTCGLRGTALYCWGTNHHGQVGDRTRTRRATPVRVGALSAWRQVSASWYHTCGVRTDLTAACWGHNQWGQLGAGGTKTRTAPVSVQGRGWTSISAGGWHTCGIKTDGSLWCWGRNDFGQLGDGTGKVRHAPVRVGSATDWVQVEASWTHTCGVRRGGQVMCWGRNEHGQVGDGTTTDRYNPQPLGITGATSVTTGVAHTCAFRQADGAVWCWGNNTYGALGTGSRASSRLPVRVAGRYRELDAGWMHTCAAEASGALACWGNNERGQLADGSHTDRATTTLRPVSDQPLAERRKKKRKRTPLSFGIATYNILGDPHTQPGKDADQLPPSRLRAEWTASWMESQDISIFGLQEAGWGQVNALRKATGGRYGMFPGLTRSIRGGAKQTLVWDLSVWRAVQKRLIRVPFIGRDVRSLPVVQLRAKGTKRKIWVINVHNAPQGRQRERNIAIRREIRQVRRLGNAPVFMVGDFNEKRTAFCKVVRRTRLVSASGGWANKRTCRPPKFMRVDWVFGPRKRMSPLEWQRPPAVAITTDHHVGVVRVRMP